MTGNVPLYVDKLIAEYGGDEYKFYGVWWSVIEYSILQLLRVTNRELIQRLYENMIRILLRLDFDTAPTEYDRKYFIRVKYRRCFQPLFPLAESVWRKKLEDKLSEYICKNESALLRVCIHPNTANDTHAQIFKSTVIQRLKTYGVVNFPLSLVTNEVAPDETVSVPSTHFYFDTQNLPELKVYNYCDGLHIPKHCNFLGIDIVWKTGSHVFGVQIHMNSMHEDMVAVFEDKCQKAGWLDEFPGNTFLIYLYPDVSCVMARQSNHFIHQSTQSGRIKIGCITNAHVECLKDMFSL
jgi:hypothetical protein